jgi:hypothetical protein
MVNVCFDCDGCCRDSPSPQAVLHGNREKEEEEPLDIASLWQTTVTDDGDTLCRICFANEIDTVIVPCGHLSFCGKCVAKLITKVCPICQNRFTNAVKVYRA